MVLHNIISNIEDFLKNRIQKEFLLYKLKSLKTKLLKENFDKNPHILISHIEEIENFLNNPLFKKENLIENINKLKNLEKDKEEDSGEIQENTQIERKSLKKIEINYSKPGYTDKEQENIHILRDNSQISSPFQEKFLKKKDIEINQEKITDKKSPFDINKILSDVKDSRAKIESLRKNYNPIKVSEKDLSDKKTNELEHFDFQVTKTFNKPDFSKKRGIDKRTKELETDETTGEERKYLSFPERDGKSFRESLPEFVNPSNKIINSRNFYNLSRTKEINYSDISLESPLYNILAGYENLKGSKINLEMWKRKIQETIEELNLISSKEKDVIEVALSLLDELNIITGEILLDENRRKIYDNYPGTMEDIEVKEVLNDLKELNEEICRFTKDSLTIKEKDFEELKIDEIDEICYKTENYLKIENMAYDLMDKKISADIFIEFLNKVEEMINEGKEKYNSFQISEDELTKEVLKASKIIIEGLNGWEEGILLLKKYTETENNIHMEEGLDLIYENNRKLVFLKYYTEKIEKYIQSESIRP